jgi:hypothetical protein
VPNADRALDAARPLHGDRVFGFVFPGQTAASSDQVFHVRIRTIRRAAADGDVAAVAELVSWRQRHPLNTAPLSSRFVAPCAGRPGLIR